MHFETDLVRVDEAAAGLVGIRNPAAPTMSGRRLPHACAFADPHPERAIISREDSKTAATV